MSCKAHHWILDEPSGAPTVKGRCKRCRKVRHFATASNDSRTMREWNELHNQLDYVRRGVG